MGLGRTKIWVALKEEDDWAGKDVAKLDLKEAWSAGDVRKTLRAVKKFLKEFDKAVKKHGTKGLCIIADNPSGEEIDVALKEGDGTTATAGKTVAFLDVAEAWSAADVRKELRAVKKFLKEFEKAVKKHGTKGLCTLSKR